MIIKNAFGEIMKISLISGKETLATKEEVLFYFKEKIKAENIKLNSIIPFLWKDDRILYGNIELVSTKEIFNIFMNKIYQKKQIKKNN